MTEAHLKMSLLRMSLDQRLAELPADTTLDKIDILRQELETVRISTHSRNFLTVAKMAALTGKLSVRLVSFMLRLGGSCGFALLLKQVLAFVHLFVC